MTDIPKCPKCNSEYTYFDGMLYVCPDCAHEFSADDTSEEVADVAKDSNGAELFDGDAVTVIKDLKVKGSSMVIKRGQRLRVSALPKILKRSIAKSMVAVLCLRLVS